VDELERLAHELGALARRRWPDMVTVTLTLNLQDRRFARTIVAEYSDMQNQHALNNLVRSLTNTLMYGDLDRSENDADGR
jgi:hypothetical protein